MDAHRVLPSAAVPGSRWRVVARAVWPAVAAGSVMLFALSLPPYYRDVLTLDEFGSFGPPMTPAEVTDAFHRLGISPQLYAGVQVATMVLFAVAFWTVGALIHRRRPYDRGAWVISLALVTFGATFPNTLGALAEVHPAVHRTGIVLGQVGFAAFFLLFYLFPDGRFVPRWTRWVAVLLVAELIIAENFPDSALNAPPIWVTVPMLTVLLGLAGALLSFLVLGNLPELVPALGQPGVTAVLYESVGVVVLVLAFLLVPATIGIAILRYRLFDIDLIISRTLLFGALTAAVVGIYVLVVGGIGALLAGRGTTLLSLLATGLVAALVIPLRTRLQRGVNGLVYGDRDDPYALLTRLGTRLETSIEQDGVLPAIVDTVGSALKLPYVAIETAGQFVGRTTFAAHEEGNAHSSWTARGGRILIQCDEDFSPTASGPIEASWGYPRFFDISDPADPVQLSTFELPSTRATPGPGFFTVHDPKVRGNLAYLSWYAEGVVILDITNPAEPRKAAQFVPEPAADPRGFFFPGEKFANVWGVFIERDYVIASDINSGLWVFKLDRR